MRTYQACIPCIKNLVTSTLDRAEVDEDSRAKIQGSLEAYLAGIDMSLPPARTAGACYQLALRESGLEDFFQEHKRASIQEALKLYPRLIKLAREAPDPLEMAIRISALGNILDIANPASYDLEEEITRLLDHPILGESLEILRARLAAAGSLLILGDNAGETVFDKVLIETLQTPVVYAVKSKPAFDDALLEDATQAGIDQVASLIASGTPYPGTYLPSCSPHFQQLFRTAPLILAKGQANYETLSDVDRDIFFLLKTKCDPVSSEIGYPLGSLALAYHPG